MRTARVMAGWAMAVAPLGAAVACGAATAGDHAVTVTVTTTIPPSVTTAPVGAAAPVAVQTVGVGETATGADYELTVQQYIAPVEPPNPAVPPAVGHMYARIDVELTNVSASDRDATYLRLEFRDAAGTVYPRSSDSDHLPSGWVPPDAPQRFTLLVEVPSLVQGLEIALRPDVVSDVVASVRLT
jgi:hypothetical protein